VKGNTPQEKGHTTMKLYNVYVHNNRDNYNDCYMVNAEDPVDARNVAVQRLIDETGDGLNVWEILGVKGVLSSKYGKTNN
jgi:hypothetical protein